jgi:hypothetical protein
VKVALLCLDFIDYINKELCVHHNKLELEGLISIKGANLDNL